MYLDAGLELASGQVVTAAADTQNTIDFGQARPNIGDFRVPVYAVLSFAEKPTFTGSSLTLSLALQGSDLENSGFVDLLVGQKTFTDVDPAAPLIMHVPVECPRYLKGHIAVVDGTLTTATVNVHLVQGPQFNEPYPGNN